MYYLVKGNWRGEEDSSFEWVIKAESEKEALAEIDDNCEVNEIRVISAEERIEREKEALFENIRREYILNHYGDFYLSPLYSFLYRILYLILGEGISSRHSDRYVTVAVIDSSYLDGYVPLAVVCFGSAESGHTSYHRKSPFLRRK